MRFGSNLAFSVLLDTVGQSLLETHFHLAAMMQYYTSGLPLNSFSVSRHLLLHLFHVRIFSENSSFSISLLACQFYPLSLRA